MNMYDHIDIDKCKILFSALADGVDRIKKEDSEKAILRERIKKIRHWNPDEAVSYELKRLTGEVDQSISRQKIIVEKQISEQKFHASLCEKVTQLEQKIHDFLERSSQTIPVQKAALVSRREKIKSLRTSISSLERLTKHIRAEKKHHPHELKKVSDAIVRLKKRIKKISV